MEVNCEAIGMFQHTAESRACGPAPNQQIFTISFALFPDLVPSKLPFDKKIDTFTIL